MRKKKEKQKKKKPTTKKNATLGGKSQELRRSAGLSCRKWERIMVAKREHHQEVQKPGSKKKKGNKSKGIIRSAHLAGPPPTTLSYR